MSDPYATDETITLPVTAELAAELAAQIYLPAKARPVVALALGGVELSHWRVTSITTGVTGGGYKQVVATYQRILI